MQRVEKKLLPAFKIMEEIFFHLRNEIRKVLYSLNILWSKDVNLGSHLSVLIFFEK
jgi:hypothetical protein